MITIAERLEVQGLDGTEVADAPQPPASVLQQVRMRVPLTPGEASKNRSGYERFDTFLRWASS
ncbi:MAG: hypothetical protein ACRDTT_16625 [Pseudonocardiaceae bacterium]